MDSPRPEKKVDRKQLHIALRSAFLTRNELRILVSYELQQNLDAIASDSNLETTIFELIRWAEARGYIEKLLQAALNSRPDNALIQAIAKEANLELSTFSHPSNIEPTELRSVQKDDLIYQIHTTNRNDHFDQEIEINTDTIFIARGRQMASFRSLLETWPSVDQSTMNKNADEVPSPSNKLQGPIVLIYGEGGLGKSKLIEQYHILATGPDYRINSSRIIDWESRFHGDWLFSPSQLSNEIDTCEYYRVLCSRLAKALNKREEDFAEYRQVKSAIDDATDLVEKVIKRMRVKDPYTFLHLLNTQTTRQVLHAFSVQESDQALEKVKAWLGKNVDIQREHLVQFVEVIKQKLSTTFDDYLQPMYCLGAALGCDLHRFAGKDSILVFFDTYERVLSGDLLLRIVMYAAGARVGWVIAGRHNLWSGSDQVPDSGVTYGYKDIVYHGHPVDLNTQHFSVDDIMTYFSTLQQSSPSLPALERMAAERVFHATGGLPLAVRIIAEIYIKRRHIGFLVEAAGETEIAEKFVHYYFRHVLNNEEERSQLSGLALLRRTNDNRAIIASLGLDQEHIHSYEKYLKKLQKSYRFLFTGQNQINLYQYIRRFLRSWLLNACYNLKIENIIKNVKSVYQNQLNTLEKTRSYQDVQSRLEDDEWVEAYLDLAEIHYWLDAHEGILYSILILLAVTAYRPNAHYDIIQIGTFFETSMKQPAQKWWSLATRFLYAPSSMYPVEAQKQGLKDLAKFLNEGKFKCTSVLAAHVQELEAIIWWQLGKVYQNSQEQQALYWYEKALSRLPEQEDLQEVILNIYWMRADNAYHQEQYKKSISFLQEALTIKYNFADAYYSLGNVYYKLKDYQSAITNYQYAIECDTSHCNAYVNLGNTHFKRGEYGRAIEEYNQSILLEDKDAILYYNRANAYEALHNYAAALNDFEDAIALDATLACAYLNRGHVYALQQKYDEAISQYKQAFELDPRDIQTAWTLRWTSFTSTSIAEKGIQALEEIAALDTKHYVSCLCRAIILWLGQREPKAALLELAQAKILEPEQCDPYFWQGMVFAANGQVTEAEEMIDQALKLGLPPLLLTPLYWLQTDQPDFFVTYAKPKLEHYHLYFEGRG